MFKNGITLNQKSWYCKLLKKMWGTEASDFKNFCPFFWLLVGSIVLLPVYIILRPLIFILSKLFGIKLATIPRKEKEAMVITVGKISSYIFQLALTLFMSFLASIMLVIIVQAFIEKIFLGLVLGTIIKIILYTLGLLVIIGIVVYFFWSNDLVKDSKKIPLTNKERMIVIPYKIISSPVRLPYNWLKKIIKEFYNRSCPLIHWK